MDRSVRAVSKGYNLVNMSRRSLSYETRLRKYSKRYALRGEYRQQEKKKKEEAKKSL